ncbi:SCO family protein [Croceitalea rosinachiae]|uniref:SCO family protein n=1 Tax=Croceitalea rosinachiae TaxID=3075596 RepID=A0ABU3A5K4_9FLAO|nr:SCO family protein [Croceitalea sp. F388]MDT0605455.1 SCO family protein [Croceitalea sp. F388]
MKKLYRPKIRVVFSVIVLFLICLASCKSKIKKEHIRIKKTARVEHLPFFNEKTFTPHWITPGSDQEKAFHKIPDFSLTNQLGETITQKTFDEKIVVVDFFFTSCPGICLKMTNNMIKIQEEFKDDLELLILSHSVTPSIDSVSVLKDYASKYGIIDNKWHLVTGDREEIYSLGRDHYFVENDLGEPKNLDDFLHTENFLLIDKNKHIRGIYNGLNRSSIAQLIVDIKALKKESI